MKQRIVTSLVCTLLLAVTAIAAEPSTIPSNAPRTFILADERDAFREFCLSGPAKEFYSQLKTEFDSNWMSVPPPAEPEEFGDPDPKKRKGDKVDKWRAAQGVCNQLAGTAEAATIFWLVTGEPKYLEKAKEFLLTACRWATGESGATRIDYNDEAHFRLWRKLPFVYDQIRDELTPEEKAAVLESFRRRGNDSFALIEKRTKNSLRNSIESTASSHSIRFMSMTGIAGLALYDDLPEAKEWLDYALHFYREQFPTWGGDDGGWAEGNAYWRGCVEHAWFQDALAVIGHSDAYANPFWRQTGYFPLYFVQPYKHTAFGDTPVAGKFTIEPMVAQLAQHLARQFQDGSLRAYADMADTSNRSLESQGLYFDSERYPAGMEFILRDFSVRKKPLPAPQPLSELPPARWFRDVGWVAMHSALGRPAEDIMLSFKSSPYGSFSHSHADQNAFILNAYGENLLINSGYREHHRSPHLTGYTKRTISKNALLIGGEAQKPESKSATGRILGLEMDGRTVWTAGDAANAYNDALDKPIVKESHRDILMVDQRYFVLRDTVRLEEPKTISWLLHAESAIHWDPQSGKARIQQPKAGCEVTLIASSGPLEGAVTSQFPIPVDPKYDWPDQYHLTATAPEALEHRILTVIWPWKGTESPAAVRATLGGNTLTVHRPDGKTDVFAVSGERLALPR
jgi:hypothetical protein